ncbi:site-specific DNA-methyltransferase [bacterium]|nr:site-specific DNA-methyltransferase [bacterium]
MLLEYQNKASKADILAKKHHSRLVCENGCNGTKKKLILGDNAEILRHLIADCNVCGHVDLVYIDPPFATNSVFRIGKLRAATISSSHSDRAAYKDLLTGSDFIEFLRERLILLREVMSQSGSIYLHIDYKIGHYVKIVMDEVFGAECFRSDIARIKCNPKNFEHRAPGNVKDLILFYTKSAQYTWNEPRTAFSEEDITRLFAKVDENGRRYTTVPLHAPGETQNGPTGQPWKGIPPPKGRHWRSDPKAFDELDREGLIEWSRMGVPRKILYADEAKGKRLQDIWEFKDPQYPSYPTQKNLDMLKLIISMSSNKGDLVLDCFCGSGTTLLAAEALGRNWIGIDQSEEAMAVTRRRLDEMTETLFQGKPEYDLLRVAPPDA